MALPVPRAVRVALGLARLCALVVCAAGALVLASWHFDFSALEPLFPHLHSMLVAPLTWSKEIPDVYLPDVGGRYQNLGGAHAQVLSSVA